LFVFQGTRECAAAKGVQLWQGAAGGGQAGGGVREGTPHRITSTSVLRVNPWR